ncbi:type III pantothenate kinase [Streptomyces sp. NPDC048514]|uniref:type III pantothenate kinase n=1 Tax=Streptomyces sp. NPDC048514 TaxID=3365564 RepID=UPI003710E506
MERRAFRVTPRGHRRRRRKVLNGATSRSRDLLLLIDVGNSRVKAAPMLPDGTVENASAFPLDPSQAEHDSRFDTFVTSLPAVPEAVAAGGLRLVVSDPAGRLVATVRRFAERHSCRAEHMTAARLPGRVLTRNPERLGTDRLAAALGAFRRFRTGALVIDMGTALCVDLVSAEGAYAGGILYPGIDLAYRALHDRTGLPLPAFAAVGSEDTMPTSTEEALRRGGRVAVPALVAALTAHVRGLVGSGVPAVLTGGGCVPFLDLLPADLPYDPLLNLRGMAEYVLLTDGVTP